MGETEEGVRIQRHPIPPNGSSIVETDKGEGSIPSKVFMEGGQGDGLSVKTTHKECPSQPICEGCCISGIRL